MSEILEGLQYKLRKCGIHVLRQLGRAAGVYSPTNKKKDELIADILAIAANRADPVPVSRRGAPPKSGECDRELLEEIETCRRYYIGRPASENRMEVPETSVSAPRNAEEGEYCGLLESSERYTFFRPEGRNRPYQEVFVHSNFIARYKLRTGDRLVCMAQSSEEEGHALTATHILSVNGMAPDELCRDVFENLTPCYPSERITLSHEGCSLTERVVDLFCPIGKGQRALIAAPAGAGGTVFIKKIASAVLKNYPEMCVNVALIGGRPEDATDLRRSLNGAAVACATFDNSAEELIRTADLVLENSKRLVESGRDVVLFLDNISLLVGAYSEVNRHRGVTVNDFMEIKRLFGAARNTEEGGSLTIVTCALTGSGVEVCDEAYKQLYFACNMFAELSSEHMSENYFPAVDIISSGTRKSELILTEEQFRAALSVRAAFSRGLTYTALTERMASAADNGEFIDGLQNFLEQYR